MHLHKKRNKQTKKKDAFLLQLCVNVKQPRVGLGVAFKVPTSLIMLRLIYGVVGFQQKQQDINIFSIRFFFREFQRQRKSCLTLYRQSSQKAPPGVRRHLGMSHVSCDELQRLKKKSKCICLKESKRDIVFCFVFSPRFYFVLLLRGLISVQTFKAETLWPLRLQWVV